MKKDIKSVLKNCTICAESNRKKWIAEKFIVTRRPKELVGMDFVTLKRAPDTVRNRPL